MSSPDDLLPKPRAARRSALSLVMMGAGAGLAAGAVAAALAGLVIAELTGSGGDRLRFALVMALWGLPTGLCAALWLVTRARVPGRTDAGVLLALGIGIGVVGMVTAALSYALSL